MGGRGGSSGLSATKSSGGAKWDYREVTATRSRLEDEFSSLKKNENKFSAAGINNRVGAIVRQTDAAIARITKEISSPETDGGDEKVLYTERRKLRALRSQALSYGKNH